MVKDVLPTNNTVTTPGTLRILTILDIRKLPIYQLVKIALIEYFTSTRRVTPLHMLSNIVIKSATRPTNTNTVKRIFVINQQNGSTAKQTPTFLILTTVKVPVQKPPEVQVAMPAQTQRNISTAPSQEFVSTETFSVMDTSTVSMEKMKIMIPAFQYILSIKSYQNTEQRNVRIECILISTPWLCSVMEFLNVPTKVMNPTFVKILTP